MRRAFVIALCLYLLALCVLVYVCTHHHGQGVFVPTVPLDVSQFVDMRP